MVLPSTAYWALCGPCVTSFSPRAFESQLSLPGLLVHIAVLILYPGLSDKWPVKDTAIVPTAMKVFMAGIPLTPVPRISGAIFLAATDATPDTNGAVYVLPDEGEVFRVPHVQLNEGVYALINNRAKRYIGSVNQTYSRKCNEAHIPAASARMYSTMEES